MANATFPQNYYKDLSEGNSRNVNLQRIQMRSHKTKDEDESVIQGVEKEKPRSCCVKEEREVKAGGPVVNLQPLPTDQWLIGYSTDFYGKHDTFLMSGLRPLSVNEL